MERKREIEELPSEEVQHEIRMLNEYFREGFLNPSLEYVICHPLFLREIVPNNGGIPLIPACNVKLPKRGIWCNVYFNAGNCKTKKDVQMKVLQYWSRDAHKSIFAEGHLLNKFIHDYIRGGINFYLGTKFTDVDMETIYEKIGGGINRPLCEKFVDSGFDMKVLEGK